MKVRCARLLEFTEAADLDVLDWGVLPAPVKVIGGGSNLLFTGDFPGTLLHAAVRGVRFTDAPDGTLLLEAGAGEPFDGLGGWKTSASFPAKRAVRSCRTSGPTGWK